MRNSIARPAFKIPLLALLACVLPFTITQEANAEENLATSGPLDVFVNADMTHGADIGNSIALGVAAGLAVGAERFGGPKIHVHARDHRNNMRRTGETVTEAIENPNTLAMIGGMETPHYLKHGQRINEENLVVMLPWSAGAILTRLTAGDQNYFFRVSVDDKQAGPFLSEQAKNHGCPRVATLALDNGWGRGNSTSIRDQLAQSGAQVVHQAFVRFDAGKETIAGAINAMQSSKPDCVIFVLAGRTTALAANELTKWDTPPDVLSHWGILGGGFLETADATVWERLDFALLATCYLTMYQQRSTQFSEAVSAAAQLRPGINELGDIPSPMAFVHAYDIGLLLRAAAPQAQRDPRWFEGRASRSAALRDALQSLDTPVEGLLKRYVEPFDIVGPARPDGHDALGSQDLCLVNLGQNGQQTLSPWGASL